MWQHNEDKKFALTEPDRKFLEDAYTFPVEVFANMATGEVKLFASGVVKQIGVSNILRMLNDEEERKQNAI